MAPAITVHDVAKTYRIYWNPYGRLLERMPWWKGKRIWHTKVEALKNVNFEVAPGHCVGLVGGNGAGKSTLLKILTGTTFPTRGSYTVRGRVASLLELGAGFHPDFSGRENVYMNAAIMGLSRAETEAKFEQILAFSELGKFIDAPIRTYSSGMICRLGFSVAIAIEPDVLIIDEILAVGDMHFQRKCVDRIWEYKNSGKTLFFCSHSLYDVRQICDTAIWMRGGEVAMMGDAVTVTNEYASYENAQFDEAELQGDSSRKTARRAAEEQAAGAAASRQRPEDIVFEDYPRIVRGWTIDLRTGEDRNVFAPGEDVGVRVHVRNGVPNVELCIAIGICLSDGTIMVAATTEMDGKNFDFEEGHVTLRLPGLRMLSGEYTVPIWLMDKTGVHRWHERPTENNLVIQNRTKDLGYYLHDHSWDFEVMQEHEQPQPEGRSR